MVYYRSGCRYCAGDDYPLCQCDCHKATQEDIEHGGGRCTPLEVD